MISVKDQSLRDLCLLWGCPGVVFLTISMFVALKVGADFQQDSLAKWAAFLLCNLLLWLLYVMFQSILVDLLPKKWKGESPITRPLTEQDSVLPDDKVASENIEPATESEAVPLIQSEPIQYTQRCKEYELEQEKKRQETIAAIKDYTRHTMSPFVYDDGELEKLCNEIQKWAGDYTYTPAPVRLKQKLTTVDLRHFVWNIGERLGSKNDYSGYVRADFIKSMFPNIFMDMNLDSIRNFKFHSLERKEAHKPREPRESREYRDSRGSRDSKDSRDFRKNRSQKDFRNSKDFKKSFKKNNNRRFDNDEED